MKNIKKITIAVFLALLALPAVAQEKTDTTYTFRFMTGKDMFYVPWSSNDSELSRLEACVEKYKAEILEGRMPLRVDGYCDSQPTETENLAVAKIRSNRVKSELIVRRKLTEECFITRNHASGGDCVVVRIKAPSNLPPKGEAKEDSQISDESTANVTKDSPATDTANQNLPPKGEAGDYCAG